MPKSVGFACPTEPAKPMQQQVVLVLVVVVVVVGGVWDIVTAPPTLLLEMPPFFSFMSSLILGPWVCSKALLSFVQCYPAAVA